MMKMMIVRTMTLAGYTQARTRAGVMALAFTLFFPGLPCRASQTGDSLSVTFHGTLKRKPCRISNNQTINISFGKIGTRKIDGINYKQPIAYTLTCEDQDPSAELTMMLNGRPTSYNAAAIETSVPGLGILILKDDQPMKIGERTSISQSSPPTLQAVPVQQQGSILAAGNFQATATLLAEYK
ncbi:fimbrial protein [Enterobacter bugandensis]|uniref:Fimbrial protein n=1 Tax=Enterobacter bugandensis TaxID=881260 RepID=A0AA42PWE3_9ENTR|nr:fimbrial protein [Enterobacter bugandensis]MDH1321536.1 fimbrial protein [Enterobacter bugandensis]